VVGEPPPPGKSSPVGKVAFNWLRMWFKIQIVDELLAYYCAYDYIDTGARLLIAYV